MTYDSFISDPFNPFLGLIVVGAIFLYLGMFALAYFGFVMKKAYLFGIASVILVASVGVVLWMDDVSSGIKAENRVTAENNLKKKYEILKVYWEEGGTYPESYDPDGIVVEDQNNNILKYQYRIDNETKEPFLLNVSEESRIKSSDLLLNK